LFSINIDSSTNSSLLSSSQTSILGNKIKINDKKNSNVVYYNDDYLNFKFMFTDDENNQIPQCIKFLIKILFLNYLNFS